MYSFVIPTVSVGEPLRVGQSSIFTSEPNMQVCRTWLLKCFRGHLDERALIKAISQFLITLLCHIQKTLNTLLPLGEQFKHISSTRLSKISVIFKTHRSVTSDNIKLSMLRRRKIIIIIFKIVQKKNCPVFSRTARRTSLRGSSRYQNQPNVRTGKVRRARVHVGVCFSC